METKTVIKRIEVVPESKNVDVKFYIQYFNDGELQVEKKMRKVIDVMKHDYSQEDEKVKQICDIVKAY